MRKISYWAFVISVAIIAAIASLTLDYTPREDDISIGTITLLWGAILLPEIVVGVVVRYRSSLPVNAPRQALIASRVIRRGLYGGIVAGGIVMILWVVIKSLQIGFVGGAIGAGIMSIPLIALWFNFSGHMLSRVETLL